MHCTINRKYLRYFERNPRNIVHICANIYANFNGKKRGLLPPQNWEKCHMGSPLPILGQSCSLVLIIEEFDIGPQGPPSLAWPYAGNNKDA